MNTVALILCLVAIGCFLWAALVVETRTRVLLLPLGLAFYVAGYMVQLMAETHTQHF